MTPREQATALTAQALAIGAANPLEYSKLLMSAAAIDPRFTPPLFHLGNAACAAGMLETACVLWKKCIALDAKDIKSLVNLGHQSYWLGRLDEARQFIDRALAVDPDNYLAYINLSLIENTHGNFGTAITAGLKAIELGGTHDAEMAVGFAKLFSGDFAEGLRYHEARFKNYEGVKYLDRLPWPKWNGEDGTGKSIVVIADQGIGDTLSFTRFTEKLLGRFKTIHLMVNPELLSICEKYFGPYGVKVQTIHQTYPNSDCWTTFMSLPVPLKLTNQEIINTPTLNFEVPRARQNFLKPGFNIGICWSGNPGCAIEKFRRVPLKAFEGLANIPEVNLYSFQVGPSAAELDKTGFATFITNLSPFIKNVEDTLSILPHMDLIITAETSLGHMAGAIHKPCWLLYNYHGGDFRIGRVRDEENHKVLWYPNHKVFLKGEKDKDWSAVFIRVQEKVNRMLNVCL